jgi:hypothetical protein
VAITPKSDYRYRAFVPRADVAKAIAHQVNDIAYTNFKNHVAHGWLAHLACLMMGQLARPRSRGLAVNAACNITHHPRTFWFSLERPIDGSRSGRPQRPQGLDFNRVGRAESIIAQ